MCVHKVIMHNDVNNNLIKRWQTTSCYGDSFTIGVDCIVDQFSPGQTITIKLISAIAVVPAPFPCDLVSYQSSRWAHLVENNCTPLFTEYSPLQLNHALRATNQFKSSLYQYHIYFILKYPYGFQIYNGSSTCNQLLTRAYVWYRNLGFQPPSQSLDIGSINEGRILCAKVCFKIFEKSLVKYI